MILKVLKIKHLGILVLMLGLSVLACDDEPVNSAQVVDTDNDGVIDSVDNCPLTPNPSQSDTNGNGIGDICEGLDSDNDGIMNGVDNCPNISNPNQEDSDGDGIGDACETNDEDGDGIPDDSDNCPTIPNPSQDDTDGNGIGDACENITPLQLCENGFAGDYPCDGYDLMSYMSLEDLTLTTNAEGNDCWGWKDPSTGKEYALMATTMGISFVDISNPTQPFLVGILPTQTVNSTWRDVKVYDGYAFVVSEAAGHGMQIFNLSHLENVINPPEVFTADDVYTGFGSAHNLAINETTGFAYALGSNTYSGGAHIMDVQNQSAVVLASGFSDFNYTHDAQVVSYSGLDSEHSGKELFIGCNENKVVIVDITVKSNPILISEITYSNTGYAHQAWLTPDQKYLLLGDELDELNYGNNTKTLVFDVSDLDNPTYHTSFLNSTASIDHNLYTKGNSVYQANYTSGLRVLDISNIESGDISESGYFDTYPNDNNTSFNGAWSVYPYFPSGNIIISDIDRGLFIVRKQE